MEEFESVYLFAKFYTFQMVEIWLMSLNLGVIFVVEVTWVSDIRILKDNDSTSIVTHSQEFSSFVKTDGRKDVTVWNFRFITLSQAVDVNPVDWLILAWIVGSGGLDRFFSTHGVHVLLRYVLLFLALFHLSIYNLRTRMITGWVVLAVTYLLFLCVTLKKLDQTVRTYI